MTDPRWDEQLLLQYLDGTLEPGAHDQVQRALQDDDTARVALRDIAEQAVVLADLERTGESRSEPSRSSVKRGLPVLVRRAIALTVLVLIGWLSIAGLTGGSESGPRITELNGSLQWTGSSGRVDGDLTVGDVLQGGTLDSLSANSWATLEFDDGSRVTISGKSSLAVSAQLRKELHLWDGALSADIAPQSDGRPMLIHTPTADLEVLGTQLNVDVGASSTLLNVNEGRVRLTRLVDGQVVEVPAAHQLVASVDGNESLEPAPRPNVTGKWASRFIDDTSVVFGKWLPASLWLPGRLRATPLPHRPCGKKKTVVLHLAVVSVSRDESTAVILRRGSTIRVRGRMDAIVDTKIGFTTHWPRGGFAGKFEIVVPATEIELVDGEFELVLELGDFNSLSKKFDSSLTGMELRQVWAVTVDEPVGLELVQVELLPPQDQETVRSKGWWQSVVEWVEDWWVEWGSVDIAEPATDRSTRQDDPNTESR